VKYQKLKIDRPFFRFAPAVLICPTDIGLHNNNYYFVADKLFATVRTPKLSCFEMFSTAFFCVDGAALLIA